MLEPTELPAFDRLRELRRSGEPILPVKATSRYRRLVQRELRELGEPEGPLYSVVYPRQDKFSTFAPGEKVNFVEDFDHMPPGLERVVVHRYPNKILFLPTQRCFGHCQYCFRPDVTASTCRENLDEDTVRKVRAYLKLHPEVREVIFSGGDPLTCDVRRLARAAESFRSLPSVKHIRLHTRAPVYAPDAVTDDVLDFLAEYDIRTVIHAVHPYELEDEAADSAARLFDRGIRVYNQFPLLRGINDHPAVVMELAYRCNELGIGMLSVFIADPIRYGATYRMRLQRVFDIADQVFFHGEAWISNFRLCLDSPVGKVKREHIIRHDRDRGVYVFQREGGRTVYHDIPAELDVPTPLEKLLYRGATHVDLDQWR
ncbi:MAG: radical SAM protein [Phycisphaerae bacterium]